MAPFVGEETLWKGQLGLQMPGGLPGDPAEPPLGFTFPQGSCCSCSLCSFPCLEHLGELLTTGTFAAAAGLSHARSPAPP